MQRSWLLRQRYGLNRKFLVQFCLLSLPVCGGSDFCLWCVDEDDLLRETVSCKDVSKLYMCVFGVIYPYRGDLYLKPVFYLCFRVCVYSMFLLFCFE